MAALAVEVLGCDDLVERVLVAHCSSTYDDLGAAAAALRAVCTATRDSVRRVCTRVAWRSPTAPCTPRDVLLVATKYPLVKAVRYDDATCTRHSCDVTVVRTLAATLSPRLRALKLDLVLGPAAAACLASVTWKVRLLTAAAADC